MAGSRRSSAAAAAILVGWSSSAPVLAQEAAEERSQSFRAVEGAVEEDVPGGPLVVAAYGLIWVLLLLYVVRLARKQQRTQADVERLERLFEKGEAQD